MQLIVDHGKDLFNHFITHHKAMFDMQFFSRKLDRIYSLARDVLLRDFVKLFEGQMYFYSHSFQWDKRRKTFRSKSASSPEMINLIKYRKQKKVNTKNVPFKQQEKTINPITSTSIFIYFYEYVSSLFFDLHSFV